MKKEAIIRLSIVIALILWAVILPSLALDQYMTGPVCLYDHKGRPCSLDN